MIKIEGLENGVAGVYKIICSENQAIYIGQSNNIKRRLREHSGDLRANEHRNHRMQEDFNLYGEAAFSVEIITTDKDSLDSVERNEILAAREFGICYNVFSGGRNGFDVGDEFRKKISRANKGRVVSFETRAKQSENAKRQWKNQEYRELMTESARNQWKDEEYRRIMYETHTGRSDTCGNKLNPEKVLEMRKRYQAGEKISIIAKDYDVTYCSARAAISGESWKNI